MLHRTTKFDIPNRVCQYLEEPRDCVYKGRENIHTCCQEECPLIEISLREGNYIREVGVLGGRLREQADEMGLKETDLVFIKTTTASENQLPVYELEKVEGSPTEFIRNKFLNGGLMECVCHGVPFSKCPNEEHQRLSPEERKTRGKAFIDLVQSIVDDPDFEDKVAGMYPELYELSDEQWNKRYTM